MVPMLGVRVKLLRAMLPRLRLQLCHRGRFGVDPVDALPRGAVFGQERPVDCVFEVFAACAAFAAHVKTNASRGDAGKDAGQRVQPGPLPRVKWRNGGHTHQIRTNVRYVCAGDSLEPVEDGERGPLVCRVVWLSVVYVVLGESQSSM